MARPVIIPSSGSVFFATRRQMELSRSQTINRSIANSSVTTFWTLPVPRYTELARGGFLSSEIPYMVTPTAPFSTIFGIEETQLGILEGKTGRVWIQSKL